MDFMFLHPRLADCRRLFLRNYKVNMRIGVYQFEQENEQCVVFNVDLFVPLALSTPVADQLSEVLDYGLIRRTIIECTAHGHIHLQETLCDNIAQSLLAHPSIRAARVRIEKPDAYPNSEGVGVEVFHIKNTE